MKHFMKHYVAESLIWFLVVMGASIALASHLANKFAAFLIYLAARLRGKGDGVSDIFDLHGEDLISSAVSIVQASGSKVKSSNPAADEELMAREFEDRPLRGKRSFQADGNIWGENGESGAAQSQSPDSEFEEELEQPLAKTS